MIPDLLAAQARDSAAQQLGIIVEEHICRMHGSLPLIPTAQSELVGVPPQAATVAPRRALLGAAANMRDCASRRAHGANLRERVARGEHLRTRLTTSTHQSHDDDECQENRAFVMKCDVPAAPWLFMADLSTRSFFGYLPPSTTVPAQALRTTHMVMPLALSLERQRRKAFICRAKTLLGRRRLRRQQRRRIRAVGTRNNINCRSLAAGRPSFRPHADDAHMAFHGVRF